MKKLIAYLVLCVMSANGAIQYIEKGVDNLGVWADKINNNATNQANLGSAAHSSSNDFVSAEWLNEVMEGLKRMPELPRVSGVEYNYDMLMIDKATHAETIVTNLMETYDTTTGINIVEDNKWLFQMRDLVFTNKIAITGSNLVYNGQNHKIISYKGGDEDGHDNYTGTSCFRINNCEGDTVIMNVDQIAFFPDNFGWNTNWPPSYYAYGVENWYGEGFLLINSRFTYVLEVEPHPTYPEWFKAYADVTGTNGNKLVKDCTFVVIDNTGVDDASSFGATHTNTLWEGNLLSPVEFIDCNFVSKGLDKMWYGGLGKETFTRCYANTIIEGQHDTYIDKFTQMDAIHAQQLVPPEAIADFGIITNIVQVAGSGGSSTTGAWHTVSGYKYLNGAASTSGTWWSGEILDDQQNSAIIGACSFPVTSGGSDVESRIRLYLAASSNTNGAAISNAVYCIETAYRYKKDGMTAFHNRNGVAASTYITNSTTSGMEYDLAEIINVPDDMTEVVLRRLFNNETNTTNNNVYTVGGHAVRRID